MDPLLIGGILGGVGGLAGGILQDSGNARQARANRQFQERMSSTAVQRSVADYRAAGLNPALAYGHQASSPGGAQATMGNPVGAGISTAREAMQSKAQVDLLRSQSESVKQDVGLKAVELPHKLNMMNLAEMKAVAEISQMAAMNPLLVAHQGASNRELEQRIKRGSAIAGAMGNVESLRQFIEHGVTSAPGALQAARAWLQAANAREAQAREGIRRKFFNPQHPRAKSERR